MLNAVNAKVAEMTISDMAIKLVMISLLAYLRPAVSDEVWEAEIEPVPCKQGQRLQKHILKWRGTQPPAAYADVNYQDNYGSWWIAPNGAGLPVTACYGDLQRRRWYRIQWLASSPYFLLTYPKMWSPLEPCG